MIPPLAHEIVLFVPILRSLFTLLAIILILLVLHKLLS